MGGLRWPGTAVSSLVGLALASWIGSSPAVHVLPGLLTCCNSRQSKSVAIALEEDSCFKLRYALNSGSLWSFSLEEVVHEPSRAGF